MAEEVKKFETKEEVRAAQPVQKRGPGRPKGSGKKAAEKVSVRPAKPSVEAPVVRRGPGRPKGSGKKAPGRPAKADVAAVVVKRGPGRPKGSGKRGPGRSPKAVVEAVAVKRGPGRPKGSGKKGPGRPRKVGRPANPAKGLVTQREAKRLVKAALAVYKAKLPKLIKKELRKLLK